MSFYLIFVEYVYRQKLILKPDLKPQEKYEYGPSNRVFRVVADYK